MGDSWNGDPIEITSNTPKDVAGLRKSLITLLNAKMDEGATGYGGQMAAGLDPLQTMASNIMAQHMYGVPYTGMRSVVGGGTGGGGGMGLGKFNTYNGPPRSYDQTTWDDNNDKNWGDAPIGTNQFGNPIYPTFPSNPYYPGTPWDTPRTKPIFLPDDPMNPANQ